MIDIKIPVDIIENENSFIVIADLPGVNKEDIQITGSESSITIKALRKSLENGKYLIVERFSGVIVRTIKFKEYIDIARSKGVLENGVLKIYIPKAKNHFIIDSCFQIIVL
ncbi:MAG: Hsp20/alpha crystallin family protein [Hydrogenothermaceae bacterium]